MKCSKMKEKQQIEKITDLFGRHVDPPSPACRETRDVPLDHFSESRAKKDFFFLFTFHYVTDWKMLIREYKSCQYDQIQTREVLFSTTD